jgi:hypothetical protein
MMKKIAISISVVFVFAALIAAASVLNAQETKVVQLDVKFDPTTYVNRKTPLILVVSTFLMQNLEKSQAYIPVEVGIGNSGSAKATLTRKGIKLIDETGQSYDLVSAQEITKNYGRLNYDHEKASVPHLMGPIFFGYRAVSSRFTPEAKPNSLVYDSIDLAGNDVLIDILYFKVPAASVKGKSFELQVSAPNLAGPATITFKVD